MDATHRRISSQENSAPSVAATPSVMAPATTGSATRPAIGLEDATAASVASPKSPSGRYAQRRLKRDDIDTTISLTHCARAHMARHHAFVQGAPRSVSRAMSWPSTFRPWICPPRCRSSSRSAASPPTTCQGRCRSIFGILPLAFHAASISAKAPLTITDSTPPGACRSRGGPRASPQSRWRGPPPRARPAGHRGRPRLSSSAPADGTRPRAAGPTSWPFRPVSR